MARDKDTPQYAAAGSPAHTATGEPQTTPQTHTPAKVEKDETPEKRAARTGEPQFFDTAVAKLVERENADGDKEWVEVLSDNLYPGEKLKRTEDDEKAEAKAKAAREARAKADKDNK